jgi:prepilin-type N-terminal cleavage/methylation domain-containing protein
MARHDGGFSLVEVLVALMLLTAVALAAAAAVQRVTLALSLSRRATLASGAASAKVAQFRALAWEYREIAPGVLTPVQDSQSNLSSSALGASGAGLGVGDGLDHVASNGAWAGAEAAYADAVVTRRWRLRAGGSPDLLVMVVEAESRAPTSGQTSLVGVVRHESVAVRTRLVR